MEQWDKIRDWRRATRLRLIGRRRKLSSHQRKRLAVQIYPKVIDGLPWRAGQSVGFYWPIQAELDLRPLVHYLIETGLIAALPVVIEKQRPLVFWAWTPATRLVRGLGNIPAPCQRQVIHPDLLLVPLLGFDESGHRLGYGAGYYDRTLSQMNPKPLTVGIGLECGRLETIYPQAHDIPMDVIVTEDSFRRHHALGTR